MKPNGQHESFSGYGGIEDPDLHCCQVEGTGWRLAESLLIEGMDGFTQDTLEAGAPNCVPAAITRVLCWLSDRGLTTMHASVQDLYPMIRAIAVRHGYDPKKTGLFHDLFVYTPFAIGNMVTGAFHACGIRDGFGRNRYLWKLRVIRRALRKGMPLLMNLAFGDYKGHTVTVTGYLRYERVGAGMPGRATRHYLRVFDGWSSDVRYILWEKARWVPASVTLFVLPQDN